MAEQITIREWDNATTEERTRLIEQGAYLSPEDGQLLQDRVDQALLHYTKTSNKYPSALLYKPDGTPVI